MSWAARWVPALLVALGAAVATAHGLYEVAHASRVPAPIAWLYPLVTDGLAAVAYRATGRVDGRSASYAWTCVVLAAGLSGLAQAVYLSADTVVAAPLLRFGVGAWPAITCALVLHLLHLIGAAERATAAAPELELGSTEAQTAEGTAELTADVGQADPVTADVDAADVRPALESREPGPAVAATDIRSAPADTDQRVVDLARRLAQGEDLTGPDIATEHGVSDRTGRRLLADARAHLEQHQPLHLVTDRETTA